MVMEKIQYILYIYFKKCMMGTEHSLGRVVIIIKLHEEADI